jgi:hypothetical protein
MRITFIEHLGWYFEDCVHGGEGPAFSHSTRSYTSTRLNEHGIRVLV